MLGSVQQGDGNNGGGGVSFADLEDWRSQSKAFAGLAGFNNNSVNRQRRPLGAAAGAQRAPSRANAFSILAQQPLLGRDFTPGDERSGGEPIVIIGYTMWKTPLRRRPRRARASSLRIDGKPATIVGVMPDGHEVSRRTRRSGRRSCPPTLSRRHADFRFLQVFGRLKPDATRTAGADRDERDRGAARGGVSRDQQGVQRRSRSRPSTSDSTAERSAPCSSR